MQPAATNAQLLAGDHRFELLVDAVADYAIYLIDPQGVVATWNSGAERIQGYTADEIVGQHFSRFFRVEDQADRLPEEMMASALANGRHEFAGWQLRKDGSRFWADTVLQPVRDENGQHIGFAKITRDITQQMAAQEALLESERRFRILVQGVIDYAICMLDPSGIVTNWNAGAERLKGYTADEIVGQHFSKFYTREDRAIGMAARVLDTAAREGHFEAEGWRVRKDGSRFWASVVVNAVRDKNGKLEGFAKITRDITERRAAQEAISQSERQFRLLVANVTDYALFMLDPNGVVSSWNAGAQRIKGYSADEIIGQHFSRFYTERDRAAGIPFRALHTATHEGRFEAVGWRVRKDGSLFWANVIIDPIRDDGGELVGFVKITRDITERRNAQLALEQAQTERAYAQKMEALGQLTGGVAHDFNNLLMVVSGHIQTIKAKVAGDSKAARAAEAIEHATRRGASLTRQLLTFSRRQPSNPTVVSLAEHIEAFRSMLASSIGSGVKLVATIGPDTWPVKVDASELELALVNLGLNARDAMPSGGLISVTSENVTLVPADTPAKIDGDFVALRVVDDGVGIAPDVLPKVFDPFFTTKHADKGSGLGLSQVYGFAHQSGGTVTVDSVLGRGTTVTLYLPRAKEAAAAHDAPAPEVESAGAGTVLVVEDNPDVAGVTMSMLEQLGYEVVGVADAAAALEAVHAREFDLVISDVVMAGAMDGLGLARTLREHQPKLPVLLVTGYSRLRLEDENEFTLIHKPFDLSELGRTAARMIAEARQPPGANVVRLRDVRHAPAGKPDTD